MQSNVSFKGYLGIPGSERKYTPADDVKKIGRDGDYMVINYKDINKKGKIVEKTYTLGQGYSQQYAIALAAYTAASLNRDICIDL